MLLRLIPLLSSLVLTACIIEGDCDETTSYTSTTDTADTSNEDTSSEDTSEDDEITEVPNVIETPTTWSGTILFTGDVRIEDTLTIEPCTTILMGDRMFVGEGGRIVAEGTEDCPISFTSRQSVPGPGDWRHINFQSGASNGNIFEHVIFEYGGEATSGLITGSDTIGISFRNVLVQHTESLGLSLEQLEIEEFSNVRFAEIPNVPVKIHASNLGAISDITVEESVQDQYIYATQSTRGPITTNTTISPQSVPYGVDDLTFKAEIHVEAGTHILVLPNSRFFVQNGGNLFLDGTEEAPIIWESVEANPNPTDWRQITIDNSAGTSSTFTWATIRHAGRDGHGAINVENTTRLTLNDVTFEDNGDCDVRASGTVDGNSSFVDCN